MRKCEYCKRTWLEADFFLIADVGYWMCDECRERMLEPEQWDVMQQERSERLEQVQHGLKTLVKVGK